eukprot:PhF_6_TR7999/c0_g1_i1/m.12325/K12604/CNOT1, NOT1; CCR4-NOT transcription complex subunit 1
MDFSAVVFSHINYLIRGLNRENYNSVVEELSLIETTFGLDAERAVIRRIVQGLKAIKNPLAPDATEAVLVQLFASLVSRMITSGTPNAVTILADCDAELTEDFAAKILERWLTSVPTQVLFAASLYLSATQTVKDVGQALIIKKVIPSLTQSALSALPPLVLRNLATTLDSIGTSVLGALDGASQAHVQLIRKEYRKSLVLNFKKTPGTEKPKPVDAAAYVSLEQIVEELGPSCLANSAAFRAVLNALPAGSLTLEHIGATISIIINAHNSVLTPTSAQGMLYKSFNAAVGGPAATSNETNWNLNVFVSEIQAKVSGLDWKAAIRAIDNPRLKVPSNQTLVRLASIHQIACGSQNLLPMECLFGNWKNKAAQLDLIRHALAAPAHTVQWGSPEPWTQQHLLESLLYIGTTPSLYYDAKKVLDDQIRNDPENLLRSLLRCHQEEYASFQRELVRVLIVGLVTQLSDNYLTAACETNAKVFLAALNDAHHMELVKQETIVDLCRRAGRIAIGSMLQITTSSQLAFAIATSCSLGSTAYGSIRNWITEVLAGKGQCALDTLSVCSTAIEYLEERLGEVKEKEAQAQQQQQQAGNTAPIAPIAFEPSVAENMVDILNAFESTLVPSVVSANAKDLLEELKQRLAASLASRFSRQVEDNALTLFQKVFSGQSSIDNLLTTLIRLRDSQDQGDVDTFNCFLKKMCEEFRFFGTYPERELIISAHVYGGLIGRNVLSTQSTSQYLASILRIVLSCILRPQSEALKKFAMTALDDFKGRLQEWPQYCGHLLPVAADLENYVPGITGYITGTPTRNQVKAQTTSAPPPQALQDRISFLLNNLDQSNMENYSSEVRTLVTSDFYTYFADYIVGKRVAMEPNFHRNYISLLEHMKSPEFENVVLQATYKMARTFLRSDKIRVTIGDRSILKNLGAWIGLMTLARDRPVLMKDMDLKDLLLGGMSEGKLIAVVPFVAKILESTPQSRIFCIRNPWLMGILNTLAEIYQFPDLKLTLRFEVEVLCNKINIPIQEIIERSKVAPGSVHTRLENIYRSLDISGSTDFHQQQAVIRHDDRPGSQQQPVVQQIPPPQVPIPQQPQPGAVRGQYAPNVPPTGPAIPQQPVPQQTPSKGQLDLAQVKIPADLVLFTQCPQLLTIPRIAVEAALKEIIQPVVERSVVIACNTTRELVMKDFLSDPDDTKLRRSAQLMARNLASNLAMVTCKEPLRSGMRKILHAMLIQQAPPEFHHFLPDTIEALLRENCDVGVSVVERVAADAAMSGIEDSIAAYIEERRKLKQAGQFPNLRLLPHADDRTGMYLNQLPELLRPREGLSFNHKRVYDDFGAPQTHVQATQPAQQPQAAAAPGVPVAQPQPGQSPAPQVPPTAPVVDDRIPPAAAKAIEELNGIITMIEQEAQRHYAVQPDSILSLTQQTFAQRSLSPHHENIKSNLCRIPNMIKEEHALYVCRHVFGRLTALAERMQSLPVDKASRLPNVLNLISETYLLVLQSSREKEGQGKKVVVTELTKLLLSHERRWSLKDMTVNFIRLRLIDIIELDKHLTGILNSNENPASIGRNIVEFAGTIVQRCLVDEKLASQKDLKNTLDALERIASHARKMAAAASQSQAAATQQQPQAPQQQPTATTAAPVQPGGVAAPPTQPGHVSPTPQIDNDEKVMRVRIPTYINDMEFRGIVRSSFKEWIQICHRKQQEFSNPSKPPQAAPGQPPAPGAPADPQQPPAYNPQQQAMNFVRKLQSAGMLKSGSEGKDGQIDRFLAVCMELCVEDYSTTAAMLVEQMKNGDNKGDAKRPQPSVSIPVPPTPSFAADPRLFVWVDGFSDLIVLLIKCCAMRPAQQTAEIVRQQAHQAEVNLTHRVLQAICKFLTNDHDYHLLGAGGSVSGIPSLVAPHVAQTQFMQQPYFRFLSNMMIAIFTPPHDSESSLTVSDFLTQFANVLALLNPTRLPGFAFAWLELISHRIFMPKLLQNKAADGWSLFHRLIIGAIRFMEPYLRSVELNDSIRLFYKATMKILLVLLHDFPDFLCTYHISLCDTIPPTCIQLRNVVLSSFPRNMKLPDPFTPNLKVDLLPDISKTPDIQDKYKDTLTPNPRIPYNPPIVLAELDSYLTTRKPATFPKTLLARLKTPPQAATTQGPGNHYNVVLLNAVVLHLGAQTVIDLQREDTPYQVADSPAMDIFKELAISMDTEGRYFLLNAMVNQLRYPNNHTHYFSCVVLFLFSHQCPELEIIQEQITRVLLERLIVNRPHPWGLLITFIELVKNTKYDFWSKPFIRCTPELERLFESVGHTCVGTTGSVGAPPL